MAQRRNSYARRAQAEKKNRKSVVKTLGVRWTRKQLGAE